MKIFILGARGFPHVQGGIEKHCEETYPLLSEKFDFTVLTTNKPEYDKWKNIKFKKISTIKNKSLEKIVYAFFSSIYCIIKRPNIIHIQGLNSALFIPLLKLFRLNIVYTQHSMDYLYPKWGKIGKLVLITSEYCGSKADIITVVSPSIQEHFKTKYLRNTYLTYNGVNFKESSNSKILSYDKSLLNNKYLLFVGRITPEKDIFTLIDAFNKIDDKNLFLYIVGSSDHSDNYFKEVKKLSKLNKNIILLGQINNNELPELYKNASLFILPSLFEAFPIVPLEAIFCKTQVLLSDIDALKQFDFLPNQSFFKVNNSNNLSKMILENMNNCYSLNELLKLREIVQDRYQWETTAIRFKTIYNSFYLNSDK